MGIFPDGVEMGIFLLGKGQIFGYVATQRHTAAQPRGVDGGGVEKPRHGLGRPQEEVLSRGGSPDARKGGNHLPVIYPRLTFPAQGFHRIQPLAGGSGAVPIGDALGGGAD